MCFVGGQNVKRAREGGQSVSQHRRGSPRKIRKAKKGGDTATSRDVSTSTQGSGSKRKERQEEDTGTSREVAATEQSSGSKRQKDRDNEPADKSA